MNGANKKDFKTVKTDDLNVDEPKDKHRDHAIPGQIKRDTAAVAGGKQVRDNILSAVSLEISIFALT